MNRMKVPVPFRNKDAKRFANQFVGEVTEHGLDAVTSEINTAGLVNDDYGIGPVAELVGIEGGVVSGVINLESSDV